MTNISEIPMIVMEISLVLHDLSKHQLFIVKCIYIFQPLEGLNIMHIIKYVLFFCIYTNTFSVILVTALTLTCKFVLWVCVCMCACVCVSVNNFHHHMHVDPKIEAHSNADKLL